MNEKIHAWVFIFIYVLSVGTRFIIALISDISRFFKRKIDKETYISYLFNKRKIWKFMYVVSKYFSGEPIILHYFIAITRKDYINM